MPPPKPTPPKPVAGADSGWTSPGENQPKPWLDPVNNPPPGVPRNWWQNYLKDPKSTAGQILKKLREAGGDDKRAYQLWDSLVNPQYPGSATGIWNNSSPEIQKAWTDALASGNPHHPFSTEGRLFAEEHKREAERDTALGFIDDFVKTKIPNFEAVLEKANAGNAAAIQQLLDVINNIKDPEVNEFIDDYVSQAATAGPSQAAMARQIADYDKLKSLSDPTITAEERLMQEMARRKQEQDLKSQRGAFANDLQARGVYGSGAELTMNLAAGQEAAQRRAYDEMQAQANAQKRAMDALYKASDLSTSIRGSEAQESQFRGTAADRAKEFKMKIKEDADRWRAELLAALNRDRVTRTAAGTTAVLGGNQTAVQGASTVLGAHQGATGATVNAYTGGTTPVQATRDDTISWGAAHEDDPDRVNA